MLSDDPANYEWRRTVTNNATNSHQQYCKRSAAVLQMVSRDASDSQWRKQLMVLLAGVRMRLPAVRHRVVDEATIV
jgi:hypothetical protein